MQGSLPRWPHWLAVLTACCTLPLLAAGAEVTTRGVGMVDPKGFRWPWEIVPLLAGAVEDGNFALTLELSHRMFGFLVGIFAIGLCVALAVTMRGWKRWLGLGVLVAVVAQGLLGRYRVDLNALMGGSLALIHGCFAQLVFALLVAAAVLTSPGWNAPATDGGQTPWRWRHLALMTAVLIYGQLVLGAVVRHRDLPFGARAHLLGAFVVVAAAAWLVKLAVEERRGGWSVALLAVLVTLQVGLGVEAWLSKFADPRGHPWSQLEPLPMPTVIRTAHFLVGALLFATSVTVALWAHRQAAMEPRRVRVLEGAT